MDVGEKYHIHSTRAKKEYIKKRELDPDEEITMTYAPIPAHSPGINALKSSFESRMSSGINTTVSVFDKTAVFHTDR